VKWESMSGKRVLFYWCLIWAIIWGGAFLLVQAAHAAPQPLIQTATYQGKTAEWWAKRAVQARKDANARARTVRRLKLTLNHDVTIQEAVAMASVVYPALTTTRAWCLIHHESWMTSDPLHARNTSAVGSEHATGLYQFLPSTFHSTPFGVFSIYSPLAQTLAAGWMHEHGRGGEWATCR